MKDFFEEIVECGFDLDVYMDKKANENRKKYPEEMYEKFIKIGQHPEDENQMEKFNALVKKYNYKPFN